ncbi:MAG TPA: hypothetical protein VGQ38_15515 [Gaiellaceae bacterium]|nr:hypothetical protein [Gaiellaceae bacterium]
MNKTPTPVPTRGERLDALVATGTPRDEASEKLDRLDVADLFELDRSIVRRREHRVIG